ncbi:MAG: hypothetical protein ACRDN0_02050 [Trebonia sp.]
MHTRTNGWRVWRRMTALAAGALLVLLAMSGTASAQNLGPGAEVGISGGPNQFYIGGNYTTPSIAGYVQFRPNVEIGFGNSQTLLAVNFDFIHNTPVKKKHHVSVYYGAGPSFNTSFTTGTNSTGGGFDVLVGATSGKFFGEVKLGVGNSPTVKVGIGYSFGKS